MDCEGAACWIAGERGLQEAIVLGDSPEFSGRVLAWSEEGDVRLEFIPPGTPVQNTCVESAGRRLRAERLSANRFTSPGDPRRKIEIWGQGYNRQTRDCHRQTGRFSMNSVVLRDTILSSVSTRLIPRLRSRAAFFFRPRSTVS